VQVSSGAVRRVRIYKNAWFAKFARKECLDDAKLIDAVRRAEAGLVDARLGDGLIKQRVARAGEGRSGGYRTLILFRTGERAVFVFGFAKSAQANLDADELAAFRKAAKIVLALSQVQIDAEVAAGAMMEVESGDDL
jgi:hypothetical protein